MKRFELHRRVDETGMSGTGRVAEGVQFDNGTCVLAWLTEWTSTAVYPDIATLEHIHGHGEKRTTDVVWID